MRNSISSQIMSKPKVLIVGCGAVGLSAGFFLSSGAEITYLVRPGRKSAFVAPKNLYSYKDNELHTFDNYRVIEDPSEVSGETFAFVLDTLDGFTARSENGIKTLNKVGALINEKQNAECFVVYDAVGLAMEEHYSTALGIPPTRLLFAASLLAHQPTSLITIPPNADKSLIAKADNLYVPVSKNVGLTVVNTQPRLTKRLKQIYDKNGVMKISAIPAFMGPVLLVMMLHLVTWHMDGWHEFHHLRHNKDLWPLMLRAQKEILTLPRLGWTGWLLSWVFGGWAAAKFNQGAVDAALPMHMHEFNKFHHGGKVNAQDVKMMEDLLAEGERTGHKMPALREIVERARTFEAVEI